MLATVTVESSGENPLLTWNASQGLFSSSSPKHKLCLEGEPMHPRSSSPGRCSKTLMRIRRIARAMVLFARLPGLSKLSVQLRPICLRIGPLTSIRTPVEFVTEESS